MKKTLISHTLILLAAVTIFSSFGLAQATGTAASSKAATAQSASADLLDIIAPGDRDQVGEHRTARARAAGAGPVDRDPPERFCVDLDPVQDARSSGRNGRRAGPPPAARARAGRTWASARSATARRRIVRPEHRGRAQVVGGDTGDPRATTPGERRRSARHRGGCDPRAEREPREDDRLVHGVVAFHVAGGSASA